MFTKTLTFRTIVGLGFAALLAACSSNGFDVPKVSGGGGPATTPTPTPTPPASASFAFVTASNTVTEGAGGTISVAIQGGTPASFPVTVNYSVAAGATATAGDYVLAAGTLTFNSIANETISYTTTDDTDVEATESLTVVLSNPSTGMNIASGSYTITINDNDLPTKCGTTVDLTWTAPTHNTDGSVLTNLAGFKIHYGGAPGTYSTELDRTNPLETAYTIIGLAPGDYYFAMRAYNSNNVHSDYTGDAVIRLASCTSRATLSFWTPAGTVATSDMPKAEEAAASVEPVATDAASPAVTIEPSSDEVDSVN